MERCGHHILLDTVLVFWLEGQRENVMNVETDGLQSQMCTLCVLNLEECYPLDSSVWLFAFRIVFLKLGFQSLHSQTDAHNMITNCT